MLLSKAPFILACAKDLVENDEWVNENDEIEEKEIKRRSKHQKRAEWHKLLKLPRVCEKWNGII